MGLAILLGTTERAELVLRAVESVEAAEGGPDEAGFTLMLAAIFVLAERMRRKGRSPHAIRAEVCERAGRAAAGTPAPSADILAIVRDVCAHLWPEPGPELPVLKVGA
jgi:hypothetical protein